MSANSPITDDALREAIAAAQTRVGVEQERFSQAEERLRAAERELALLAELGRLRGLADLPGENRAGSEDRQETGRVAMNLPRSLMVHGAAPARRDALVQTVIAILREHGKPMPIRALMAEVVSRGAPIPGRGEQANLISVITRVPKIARRERGVYGLREWDLDGTTSAAQRPASRRRKAVR